MISQLKPKVPTSRQKDTLRTQDVLFQEIEKRDKKIETLKCWIKALSPEHYRTIIREVDLEVK